MHVSDIDDVRPHRISVKRNFKMGWVVADNLFWPRKSICPYGKFAESLKGPANDSLRRSTSSRTAGRSSGSLSLVSNTTGGDARVPESDLKN